MNNFSKLGLSQTVVSVLDELGFENPTPVQEKAIPILLTKDPVDFIGLAQTGTGKTAAFGLPLLDLINPENSATQALIMAPTRELSMQTAQQLVNFSRNHKSINVEVVYGGANIVGQIKALKKAVQIVVATPGRLLDLIKRKAIQLEEVKYVVLDEADEMLNMGFQEDIDSILSHTPEHRVTWLFSATMPDEIRKITKKYMGKPVEVSVNREEKSNKDISHKYVMTKTANKFSALKRFLDIMPEMRGIMFCRTKRETQEIADKLGNLGYGVEALHGDLTQGQRETVMKRFKARSMQLLIATDVAARGIDVNDLTHVLHHTLPDQLESYTHRSGRTGRAGKKGISLAFINPRENSKIKFLEKKINISFEKTEVPSVTELKSSRINHWANLIINAKVEEVAYDILGELHAKFAHLSKDDLLKRLITTQLDHLSDLKDEEDLNETDGGSGRRQYNSKEGYTRYFINLGSIDGLTKEDLIHILSDVSRISRKHFGDLSLQKNCAFFDVETGKDRNLTNSFKDIELDGRDIRVNRDDEGGDNRGSSRGSSKPKQKSKTFNEGKRFGDNKRSGRKPQRDNNRKGRSKNRKY